MPLIRVDTTARLAEDARTRLAKQLSRIAAEAIGKPEEYVMVCLVEGATMLFAGQPGPTAFVQVHSIGGLTDQVNRTLSERICGALRDVAGIPGDRVYLGFSDVEGAAWGHDGTTFG